MGNGIQQQAAEGQKDLCVVLACDANFFHQFQQCLASIRKWPLPFSFDIRLIGIDLEPQQLSWLNESGVRVTTDLSVFPQFSAGSRHLIGMTCRPVIPKVFPGYRAYVWVDCDIRFLRPEGLLFYGEHALNPGYSLVIAHETEPTYSYNIDPGWGRRYHEDNFQRMKDEFGVEIAEYLRYFKLYNAGIFGARADSPIWARYERNLQISMRLGAHWGREQDALNVSIAEVGSIKHAPSTHNWLCCFSTPYHDTLTGDWVSPQESGRKIAVAHLSNSNAVITYQNRQCRMYEFYQSIGLTE